MPQLTGRNIKRKIFKIRNEKTIFEEQAGTFPLSNGVKIPHRNRWHSHIFSLLYSFGMGKRCSNTDWSVFSYSFISPKKFPSIPFFENNEQSIGYAGCATITRLKLKPGQKGTKKLSAEYGDALVCVRFRYDEKSGTRFKTVVSNIRCFYRLANYMLYD